MLTSSHQSLPKSLITTHRNTLPGKEDMVRERELHAFMHFVGSHMFLMHFVHLLQEKLSPPNRTKELSRHWRRINGLIGWHELFCFFHLDQFVSEAAPPNKSDSGNKASGKRGIDEDGPSLHTPPKKGKTVPKQMTPEKPGPAPPRTQRCRAATFGQAKQPDGIFLARAHRPVVNNEGENDQPLVQVLPSSGPTSREEADHNVELDEEQQAEDSCFGPKRIQRKKHSRTCKKSDPCLGTPTEGNEVLPHVHWHRLAWVSVSACEVAGQHGAYLISGVDSDSF